MKQLIILALVLVAPIASAGPRQWARKQVKADIKSGAVDAVQYSACLQSYCKGNRSSCMAYCARFAANPPEQQVPPQVDIIANNPYANQPILYNSNGQPDYSYYGGGQYTYGSHPEVTNPTIGYGWNSNATYPYYGTPEVNAAVQNTGSWSNEVADPNAAAANNANGVNPYSFETGTYSNSASLQNPY